MLGVDMAFVQRRMFTRYFGIHYGAGLGLALVRGEYLRISNFECVHQGQRRQRTRVLPVALRPAGGCNEAMLKATEGGVDGGPTQPARFRDNNVPGAIPILNVALGLDVRHPGAARDSKRSSTRGFYNAFFVGLGFAYIF